MLKTIKIIAIIVALVGLIGGSAYMDHLIKENKRLDRNQEILLEEHESETRSLELGKSDLKRRLKAQKSTYSAIVDSMDLKIKQLESITSSSSKTEIEFETVLKDTIIRKTDTVTKRDTVIKYEFFEWEDYPWVKVDGMIYKDTMQCLIQAQDTIHVANYWKRDGWFIFKLFHKKEPHSDVSNVNPYIDIHVEQSIRQK